MEIERYTFAQVDRSNYMHPLGFTYEAHAMGGTHHGSTTGTIRCRTSDGHGYDAAMDVAM
jgi:hypothetical protein